MSKEYTHSLELGVAESHALWLLTDGSKGERLSFYENTPYSENLLSDTELSSDDESSLLNLSKADFTKIGIERCGFIECNLTEADFSSIDISGSSNFYGCLLVGANFTRTNMLDTVFEDCDFKNAVLKFADMQDVRLKMCKNIYCIIGPESWPTFAIVHQKDENSKPYLMISTGFFWGTIAEFVKAHPNDRLHEMEYFKAIEKGL